MIQDKTICHYVTECLEQIESAIKTGGMDAGLVSDRLHKIRTSAQHMENALKLRKEIMTVNHLEENYQEHKEKKNTPPGLNKVRGTDKQVKGKMEFEIIIKEQGELVYQNKAFGAVLSVVERVDDIDEDGTINGQTQTFMVGHPLTIWFGFDQLKIAMEGKKVAIMQEMKKAVENNAFVKPEVKKAIIEAANNIV